MRDFYSIKPLLKCVCSLFFLFISVLSNATRYSSSQFSATPALISDASDPFVMISLSVELTQQAEAYTDGRQVLFGGSECPGRISGVFFGASGYINVGVCYLSEETYLGYFDPKKCYEYDESTYSSNVNTTQLATGPSDAAKPHYFTPIGPANSKKECVGAFSGNFMNWASMTALDEFRYAMTGGARLVDTYGETATTLLSRTHRYGDWPFVTKALSSSGFTVGSKTFATDISKVTPFVGVTKMRITNGGSYGNKIRFYDQDNNWINNKPYNVIVKVCDANVGIEENCKKYTNGVNTWYKPEGVMQENALSMRFALSSYTAHDSNLRNGGVLRANAKYIGYYRPANGGGVELNPEAEINQYGQYVYDPDSLVDTSSGVNNSGILNYINLFGLGPERYKSYDPVAELYYEGLRYIKGLSRTPEYADAVPGFLPAISNSQKDNFPIIKDWTDPIVDACQANYMVGIGDQFSWGDNSLPGASIVGSGQPKTPSNPDSSIDVNALTNKIGTLEGSNSSLGSAQRGRDKNGWYVAGLAYHARTEDVRLDIPGDQFVKTFFVDTQEYHGNPPRKEDNPLWMAAKYGGFTDVNNDGDPNNGTPGASTKEWDADGDGDPDAYTLASQPANLVSGLRNAFSEIAERVNAGSAAGVVSNSSQGEGMVVQGLFKPSHTDANGNVVEWGGILHALFIDEEDRIREDSNGDGKISESDSVIEFNVDVESETASVTRFDTSGAVVESNVSIDNLDTIWDARDELAKLTEFKTQRSYTTPYSGAEGRYIFTAIDKDNSGIVIGSDVLDFTEDNFPDADDPAAEAVANNFRYLGLNSTTGKNNGATNIVNFIRGDDSISGFRSRTVDYDNDGVKDVWRLGDIVSSSPLVVAEPRASDRFDKIYNDNTFEKFYEKYKNRRQVVYVGANDGMLHAFNAGFFDHADNAFKTQLGGSGVAHPLGAELWAYVPYNLLPHLRWLTELGYPHVFYVDGVPQTFNVNIFPKDAKHPEGWGTILVVGLRFGGGEIVIDPDSDVDADLEDDVIMRSSYIILDVTDPESEPELLAEITHPALGFTTTRATVVKTREKVSGGYEQTTNDKWYLVFGSGPHGGDDIGKAAALSSGISDQDAKVFMFSLDSLSFKSFSGQDYLTVPQSATGFTGDFVAADWNNDFTDDAVYFGTVTGGVSNPGGDLWRLELGGPDGFAGGGVAIKRLLSNSGSIARPFSGLAYTKSSDGENWIFTGSGRFYVPDDGLSTGQMGYFGIKDPLDESGNFTAGSAEYKTDLINVSDILVQAVEGSLNGTVYDSSGTTPISLASRGGAGTVSTFLELQDAIEEKRGWYIEFSNPRARHVGRSDGFSLTVGFTEYIPSGLPCKPLGETLLNFVYYRTGTAAAYSESNQTLRLSEKTVYSRYVAGKSSADNLYSPGLVRDVKFDDLGRFVGQGSLGNLPGVVRVDLWRAKGGRLSWREITIDW